MSVNGEKITVGLVIKNEKNEFLFDYSINGKMLDIGLISQILNRGDFDAEVLRDLYNKSTGHNIEEFVEFHTLTSGEDCDGEYLLFFIRVDWTHLKSNGDRKCIWLSLREIEKWHNEGRINDDQYELIKKANKFNTDTVSRIKHNQEKTHEEKIPTERDLSIIRRRIEMGRCIKRTDKSQEVIADTIIKTDNHASIQNFPEILDDEELMLKFAKITPNPLECSDYFYEFINEHLTEKKDFRTNFLRNIYLNDNVYTLADVSRIIELYDFKSENVDLLFDEDLRNKLMTRLGHVQTFPKFDPDKYENDKKYRRERDALVELNRIKEAGLKGIISKFDEVQKDQSVEE